MTHDNQRGFVLITTMLILLVLTILVVNAVRGTTLNEKMSGNYMDRTNAQLAAEQALRQGQALLVENGEQCLSGCAIGASTVTASTAAATEIPTGWNHVGNGAARSVTTATGQRTSGSYKIAQLPDTFVPKSTDVPACTAPYCRDGCKAYSIMGQGKGYDTRTEVLLQTIAFVCSV